MTAVDRIRDLKLNGKDIMESMPGNPAEINWPSAEALVDAQYTKLLKGLAGWLDEGVDNYYGDVLREVLE